MKIFRTTTRIVNLDYVAFATIDPGDNGVALHLAVPGEYPIPKQESGTGSEPDHLKHVVLSFSGEDAKRLWVELEKASG